MAQQADLEERDTLVVHTRPVLELDEEQFFRFCQLNDDLQIERTAEGDIIIMAPEGGGSGRASSKLVALFEAWSERDGTGQVFGSSTGFRLPNGAIRSPDLAWVRHDRLDPLSDDEWHRFLPLCPNFVLELRSPSDSLSKLQQKMEEYRQAGAELGWLLNPVDQQVLVYRPGAPVQVLERPGSISGEPVLRHFELEVPLIWAAMQRPKR